MSLCLSEESFGFHSISFPSEWGVNGSFERHRSLSCFHSISFPSEWGVGFLLGVSAIADLCVSIQLVSPASGELRRLHLYTVKIHRCFHSISFPSEWGDRLWLARPW